MRRDLERLANDVFDLHVIGGGATGAAIARDAALRGLRVALTEKNDFAHATSAHNSKLVHGGLRYLRNFELSLVRESLKERRVWQRIAPHLVRPLPFLMPLYDADMKTRATLAAGLTLYDLLSFDRRWLSDSEQRLPGHAWLSAPSARAWEPHLDGPGFTGAFRYYDAQMYAPERLALECLLDAADHGACLANHAEAETLLIRNGTVEGARVMCTLSGARFDLRAKLTIVAAGPWADLFLNRALDRSDHKLVRSKGIHVLVPALTRTHALTVPTKGGHFFVLPWRNHSLLGTTDTAFPGSPDRVGVAEAEVHAFLAQVNAHLPGPALSLSDVRFFYAGLRPLVDDGTGNTYGASRRAELLDHAETERIGGLVSAIGGKWTTSRHLAEEAVNMAAGKLGVRLRPCATALIPLPGGRIGSLKDLRAKGASDHLARLYGARLDGVMALAMERPELARAVSASGDIAAQIVFAMREEMAMTLADVVMRRTGMGQLGKPPAEALHLAAALMAAELGWAKPRVEHEIASLAPYYAYAGTRP